MKKYFETPKRQRLLLRHLHDWLGVPYEHMGETKSGIDCSKLLGKILLELGILSGNLEAVYKAEDWIFHSKKEFLLETVDATLSQFLKKEEYFFKKLQGDELQFGDFLFFSLLKSGVTHHSAIYLGEDKIFHTWHKGKCGITPLGKAWKKRMTWVYRLMEI